MKRVRFMGHVDKFMTQSDALREMSTKKILRYVYGEFAMRDIFSEACISDWNLLLEDGIVFVDNVVSNIIRLPEYSRIQKTEEYHEYSQRSNSIYDDLLKNVEYVNGLLDQMSIQYHFYVYEEDGVSKIRVKKDGGIV